MSKFKPCPFCGCSVPPAVQGNGIGDNWLECTECGASTRLREDGAGSEKDWNRRAAHATAPSDAAIDALKWIKVLVCGDSAPRWTNAHQTTISRGMIADIVDKAIAPMEKT